MVQLWWTILSAISVVNIAAWLYSRRMLRERAKAFPPGFWNLNWILSGGYVLGCAFRSFFPRVDVQRMALYDGWISNIVVGRTVATIAEVAFVAQAALMLGLLERDAGYTRVSRLAHSLVPIICLAEVFSWTAVLTTNFLFHAMEESLWLFSAFLILICLAMLWRHHGWKAKRFIELFIVFDICYMCFMGFIDVPMYLSRWRTDELAGKTYLTFAQGFADALTWKVTFDINQWLWEMPWLTLYFSFAVWISISLLWLPRLKVETLDRDIPSQLKSRPA